MGVEEEIDINLAVEYIVELGQVVSNLGKQQVSRNSFYNIPHKYYSLIHFEKTISTEVSAFGRLCRGACNGISKGMDGRRVTYSKDSLVKRQNPV